MYSDGDGDDHRSGLLTLSVARAVAEAPPATFSGGAVAVAAMEPSGPASEKETDAHADARANAAPLSSDADACTVPTAAAFFEPLVAQVTLEYANRPSCSTCSIEARVRLTWR